MKAPQYYDVEWDQFKNDTSCLVPLIKNKSEDFTTLVAVTRGGMVPTLFLALELGIRHIETLCLASYEDKTQGELNVLKKIEGKGKGCVIVDDLVDTGKTARFIREHYPEALFVTVYAKPKGEPFVDHYIKKVEQETWIRFPWDDKSS